VTTPRHYTEQLAAIADPLILADPFQPARNAAAAVAAAHEVGDLVTAGQAVGRLIHQVETAAEEMTAAAGALRGALARVMADTGMTQVRTDTGTWHVREPTARVVITDEAAIPPTLMEQPLPRPDKAAIARLLKAGGSCPGAMMNNGGGPVLAFRSKQETKQ
jgi:hypothetical protein